MPYDPRIVGLDTDQAAPVRHAGRTPANRAAHRSAIGVAPSGPWLTGLAFAVVAVPFVWAVLRLATAPTDHLNLPDDLALIDLHVRRALVWKQQLGVFDHNNWNHPGPSYFYLVSLVYRVLGSSVRSLFVAATLLNGLAAVACVAVVRRRTTAARALWTAMWVAALAAVLAAAGPSATTYSESVLGGLVSPWNPMVVLFPLLLLVLLCAGAVDRSAPSLVGALVVATYVLQTDISTGPLALALVVAAGVAWLATVVADRRARSAPPDGPSDPVELDDSTDAPTPGSPWGAVLVVGGLVALALAWLPPVVQQFTNQPGNITLIERFFSASHTGQPLGASLWSVAAGSAVLVVGPSEVMTSILGGTPAHAGLAVATTVATLAAALAVTVVGVRRGSRFAWGLGCLTLVGWVAAVVAVTHVVGFVFGYLVVWAVVLPVAALIGLGTLPVPLGRAASGLRVALCAVAVVAGVAACARVAAVPPLARAGDSNVTRLAALAEPHLPPDTRVAVGDAGAGTTDTQLLDTEEFIGLVNALDRAGYRPTVNAFWKAQFGPGYRTTGSEPRAVSLSTWTPASPALPGYVGKVGDMAVTVTDSVGAAAPVG